MERTLHHARLELAKLYAYQNKLNHITVPTPDAWLGIMTTGKTYYDVGRLSSSSVWATRICAVTASAFSRWACSSPWSRGSCAISPRASRRFSWSRRSGLHRDVRQGHSLRMPDRPRIVGKRDEEDRLLVPIVGELDPDTIARALAKRIARKMRVDSVEARIRHIDELKHRPKPLSLARTAYFCSGCPHNRSTVVPEGSVAAAASECHGMAMAWTAASSGSPTWEPRARSGSESRPSPRPRISSRTSATAPSSLGSLAINYAIAAGVTSPTRFSTTRRWP